MKAVMTKAHGDFKVGQQIDVTPAQFATLADGGFAITATEWDASQKAANLEAATVKARETAIDTAIADAEKAGAIPPKADKSVIRAHALVMEATAPGVGVEYIQNIRPAGAEAAALSRLAVRATSPLRTDLTPTQGLEVTASLEDVSQGIVKAMEPQAKLVQGGQFAEAMKLSREAGLLLKHKLMAPVVKAGGDYLLRDTVKAATFTDPNSQVGSLAGDLIIMRNLGYLVNKLAWLKYLTTDLTGEPVKFGGTVDTRYIVVPGTLKWVPGVGFTSDTTAINAAGTATDQSAGTTQASGTVTKSVPSTPDVAVKLDQLQACEVEFPMSLLAGTVRNLLTEQLGAQTYALAEAVNKFMLGKLFAANWSGVKTSYTKALANWNLTGMVGIKNAMTIAKIPDVGRFALLHSFYHDKLLEDSNLLSAKAIMALIHKNEAEFNTGDLPTLFGVKPLESQLASATSAGALTTWSDDTNLGTTNIVGFAGNQSSGLFVSRPPQDFINSAQQLGIPITANVRLLTEPDSGLTVMIYSYIDNGKMSISQRVLLMWGGSQGDPRVGMVLKAA